MITDNDINKLRNVFATKKDLQHNTDEIIKATTEMIGGVIEKIDGLSEKLDVNLDEVNDHKSFLPTKPLDNILNRMYIKLMKINMFANCTTTAT